MKFFGGTIVSSGGTLLCKFVPCLRNGVEPGIYDPIRDLFLANAGTGSFTYGAATGVVYGAATAPAPATAIDPTNYECSMMITPAAGSVSTTLYNFPVLVRLSAARQSGFNPADCGTNGADLRFALPDGTLLSHEIDTWSTTGESTVWVNVPALSSATQIVAYWGVKDASAAPAVNAADAWPDFVAVYHLGEGAATARDSSGNGYDARNAAAVTAGSSPKVGGCALISDIFTTDVTSLTDPTAAKPLADRSVVTFSSWVAIDTINTSSSANAQNARLELARKYSTWNSGSGGFSCRYFADNNYSSGSHTAKPLFGIAEPSGNGSTSAGVHNWNTIADESNGNWLYLTCVVNGTTVSKYINGVLATGADLNGSNTQNPRNINHSILGPDIALLQFGAREDGSGGSHAGVMRGRMDEVRIRSGAASAEWIAADFAQQNADTFLTYGPVQGAEAPPFTVEPIAAQTVTSALEFLAGVTPSVTVRDGTTSAVLAEGTDYTVAYTGNDTVGTAYATVTGIGNYDGYTVSVPFAISGVTLYYAVSGGNEGADTSSVSGAGSPTGWSTTKGGTKAVNGITAANAIYYVWENRWMRTQTSAGGNYSTPATSAIVVEPDCVWTLADKMLSKTLTLSNVVVRAGGQLLVDPVGESGTTLYSNTIGGTFDLEDGASINLKAKTTAADNVSKQYILSGTVTGKGAVWMPSSSSGATYSTTLANQITGDLSGFTGDIGTWNGVAAVSLELVNASSLPGDPAPEDVAYVVVTNGATLKVSQDWTSPTNRIWILGDGATPTINVPSGKTVTINADLVGSAGFNKTGAGTLVLKGASPDLSGTITISGGEVRLVGAAAQLSAAPGVTWVESGGTYMVASLTVSPVADQTVYDLATLAAGICPSVTVSNLEDMVELVFGTDYTVAYANNTAYGVATATANGVGAYAGMAKSVDFIIHSVKEVNANYSLVANEDWTAFESVTVASGVTIDLNGHNLTISGLNGSGTITDSVGGGELHYYVPATYVSGYEAKIESVSLTGRLKLVKEGPGNLTAIKQRQTFTGGTVVDAGILKYGCTGNNSVDSTYPFGYSSASEKGTISVSAGAILDPAGSHNWENHTITLNGGMISNTMAQSSGRFNPKLVLTADSTFASAKSYSLAAISGDLGGHTLSVWFAHNGETLYFSPAGLTNGTVYVVDGSWFRAASASAIAPTVDLSVYCALKMDYSWTVRNYTARYNQNYGEGTAALNVLGTFTPEQNHFYGPTMQDGSAIDLSAKTGAWNVKGSLTYQNNGNGTTKFAAGATVAILLGERTPAYGEKIVSWTAATKPADSVTLTNATYFLHAKADGLYAEAPRTFAASNLPDIETAWTSADIVAAIESSLVVTNLVTGDALALGTDYTYTYVLDDGRCIVTITGHGGNEGLSVERTFDIGQILVKQSSFDYSMDIAPNVGKVVGTLTNFPVLVRLSTAIEKFSYRKCKADEMRFFLPDGTLLFHDIDYWDENGESTVWVNIPELTSNTVFRACWGLRVGQGILPPITNKAWPEYVGVWHFSEESGIVHDSSGNGYHSTNNGGGTVSNVNAKVGLARNVNKTSLNTSVSNLAGTGNKKPLTTVSKFTVSGWMLSTLDIGVGSNAKWPQMMRNKNNWSDGNGWFTGYEGTSVKFNAVGSGSTRTIPDLPTSVYNNWVYLSIVYDGATTTIYEDGALVGSYAIDTVKANTSYGLRFGQDLTGRIDEFRVHDGVQSAAYVSADYATQTDPDFLTYGRPHNTAPTILIVQ